MMNPIAIRLLCQQLCSPMFTQPEEVVSHFGAMQAQDYRMVRWAVTMRTKKPSLKAFETSYNRGEIVRLHLLRGTWQLISGQDYGWMLSLFSERARTVITGWMRANRISIPDKELLFVREILMRSASENHNAKKADFKNALAERDVNLDDHRLSYHIRMAELSGDLCSGNLSPMHATYALTESKVKASANLSRDEALMCMAEKYFQSHSPASFEDFQWWCGLNVSDCRTAIFLLGNRLRMETCQGRDFYMHESCRNRGWHRGKTIFLPPFDEYLIGYKSRDIVIAPEYAHHAYTKNGIFFPVIAYDGIICGNWFPWNKSLKTSLFCLDNHMDTEKPWQDYQKMVHS